MTGNVDQVRLHIQQGTDLDKADVSQSTPLGIAVEMARTDIIKMLVDAGAKVMRSSRGMLPIHSAALRGQLDTVKLFIAKGAPVDATDQHGLTPLYHAVENDRYEVAEYLIGAGADVNARGRGGQTPMSIARRRRLTDMADLLSQHGAQEPVSALDRGPYGSRGLQVPTRPGATDAFGADMGSAGPGGAPLLGDPNEIRARLATFPGLPQALAGLDANSASEQRNWRQRRMDNRTMLIRSVEKQFDEEMTFVKGVAQAEKATNTIAAIDGLVAERKTRYAAISDELREERRAAILAERATMSRTRSSGRSRGRGADMMADNGASDPYGDPRAMSAPRTRAPRDVNEPALDPVTESQIQAWLSVDPLDKRGLLATVNELDLTEYDVLRQTATAEECEQDRSSDRRPHARTPGPPDGHQHEDDRRRGATSAPRGAPCRHEHGPRRDARSRRSPAHVPGRHRHHVATRSTLLSHVTHPPGTPAPFARFGSTMSCVFRARRSRVFTDLSRMVVPLFSFRRPLKLAAAWHGSCLAGLISLH